MVLPLRIISIDSEGLHLWVEVCINDQPAIMVVDTGASRTCFDIVKIKKFVEVEKFELHSELSTGLGTNSMQSHITTIEKLVIGELVIEQYKSVLIDLHHVNESYQKLGLEEIDGVLGSDLLSRYNAIINYQQKELVLSECN